MWFVWLWAVMLVLSCIANFIYTRKFDKMSSLIADRAVTKIADTLKQALDKADLYDKKCKSSQRQGSGSQKSQKK